VDGEGEIGRGSSLIVKFETDCAAEAMELGGLRVPSVMTESFDSFQDSVVSWESCEVCDVTLCLFLFDPLDPLDLECRFLMDSGTPSHFEFTLGTVFGSFLAE
jgi:hypothetical protein